MLEPTVYLSTRGPTVANGDRRTRLKRVDLERPVSSPYGADLPQGAPCDGSRLPAASLRP
jgi:hypothetical protein